MGALNLSTIRDGIVTALEAVPELKRRYNHDREELSDLPATTLFWRGFGVQDAVMPNTQDVPLRWALRLHVGLLQGEEVAQEQIMDISEKVVDALYTNRDLGGTCLYHEVQSGETVVYLSKDPKLIMEMTLLTYVRRK